KKGQSEEPDLARDPKGIRYQTKITKTGAQSFYQFSIMELAVASVARPKGANPEARKMIQKARPQITLLGLSTRNDQGAIVDDQGATKGIVNFFVAYGCIVMMYALILMTSMPMMQG